MKYAVKHVDTDSVENILGDLWRANLPVLEDPHEKFRWYYLDNPLGHGSVFLLTCQNDTSPEEVVGCAGVGPRTFSVNGKPLRVALLADFATNKNHRTVFPALTLQRSLRAYCKEPFAFSYGFPNASATAVLSRVGYHTLGKMARYVRVLQYEPYVRGIIPLPLLAKMAGKALNQASQLADFSRRSRVFPTARLEWLSDVDSRFDGVWQNAQLSHPILGYRGADFLRWRFVQKPGTRCDIPALVHKPSGDLRAYAVLQREDRVAHIMDLLGRTEEDVGLLLTLLLRDLRVRAVGSVSIRFLGASWVKHLLEWHGFRLREAVRDVVLIPGDQLSLQADFPYHLESWYLTDADEDT